MDLSPCPVGLSARTHRQFPGCPGLLVNSLLAHPRISIPQRLVPVGRKVRPHDVSAPRGLPGGRVLPAGGSNWQPGDPRPCGSAPFCSNASRRCSVSRWPLSAIDEVLLKALDPGTPANVATARQGAGAWPKSTGSDAGPARKAKRRSNIDQGWILTPAGISACRLGSLPSSFGTTNSGFLRIPTAQFARVCHFAWPWFVSGD